jgi:SAM-dependent methyltransferase
MAGNYPARQAWLSGERAAAYRISRHPSQYARFFREEAIVAAWLEDLPRGALVLDVPCGTGRWIATVSGRGFRYVGADVSCNMLQEARRLTGPPRVTGFAVAEAEQLPFANDSFDCVILWRLLHHIPDDATRATMLREAARVSRYKVLVSFHHPVSFTYAWKVMRRELFGFKQGGRGITHWRLKREAESSGLEVMVTRSFWKYASINWFACLRKAGVTRP